MIASLVYANGGYGAARPPPKSPRPGTTPPLALMPLRYVDHANSVRECVSVEEPCHYLQPYGRNARVGQLRLRAQQHQRADQHFAGVLAIMVRASVEQRRQEPRNATMQPLNACAGWCGQSRATQYVGNSAHQHILSAYCDRQIARSSGETVGACIKPLRLWPLPLAHLEGAVTDPRRSSAAVASRRKVALFSTRAVAM